MDFWVFFLNIPVPKQKKKESAYNKTPTLQEYTTQFFINFNMKTTENGSKEEGLPLG